MDALDRWWLFFVALLGIGNIVIHAARLADHDSPTRGRDTFWFVVFASITAGVLTRLD